MSSKSTPTTNSSESRSRRLLQNYEKSTTNSDRNRTASRSKLKPRQNSGGAGGIPVKKYSHSSLLMTAPNTNGQKPNPSNKCVVELGQSSSSSGRPPSESERPARKAYNNNFLDGNCFLDDFAAAIAIDDEDDDGTMLRNPQAQGRSQSFRHRPVARVGGTAVSGGATTRTTPATTADASQERRRSTPTIQRRCSLQNRSRVEPRIDAWPEPKQRSEAEERFLALPDACDYTRVRQFNIDAKGAVIARGDSFRRKRQQQVVHAQRSNPIATVTCNGGSDHNTATEQNGDAVSTASVGKLAERPASAGVPLQCGGATSSRSASSVSSGGGIGKYAPTTPAATADSAEGIAVVDNCRSSSRDRLTPHNTTTASVCLSPPVEANGGGAGGDNVWTAAASTSATLRICVVGQSGAGKSSLIRRFVSSEYRNVFADELFDDTNCETTAQNCSVSINIGGHECDLSFAECNSDHFMADTHHQRGDFHAYLLVYSIDRKASFRVALRALEELREVHCPAPIILVGNKMDLERKRAVMENEVKSVMLTHDVPHFQISVALNHDVDDLLVGIVAQIKEAFQMNIANSAGSNGVAGGQNVIRPASRRTSKDGGGGGFDSDFHAAIRRFSRRKKRQMGLSDETDMDTGKCTNLFDKLRRWRKGTANL